MTVFAVPASVAQNISRAKSLLRREESVRALESLITGLEQFEKARLRGRARFETEVLIQECVQELNRQPRIRQFFETLAQSPRTTIPYAPGQEKRLLMLLPIIHKGLVETDAAREQAAVNAREERKRQLRAKGQAYLQAGDAQKGKAALRTLGEEFGNEPGVLCDAGHMLMEAELYFEAAEFLEQAMEAFPRDSKAYAAATQCYLRVREYAQAETVYMKALRQFGTHPKTLLNMARLYLAWGKKEKAFLTAQSILRTDPDHAEARALVEKYF